MMNFLSFSLLAKSISFKTRSKINFKVFVTVWLLSGCGGSEVNTLPPAPQEDQSQTYTGPAPLTEDIQKYKTALWDNISATDKCGACHIQTEQAPYFASRHDINDAYSATNPLVNLSTPAESRLVSKVSSGHNCWLNSNQACAETMQQWIKLWADDRVSVAITIELKPPVIREPGSSKSFPAESQLFSTEIAPIVQIYCAACHNESATNSQSPFFASDDMGRAYQAAKRVINLDNPSQSRLVVRLGNEFHNCWSDCADNSAEMLAVLTRFSDLITVDTISEDMVISKSLRLTDGLAASSGGRFEDDAIALYQFKTSLGNTAYDTSGISPAANLTLSGNIEWLGSWGLAFNGGKAQASTANSKKLHDLITATGEFSIEAWLTPNNVVQEGPARIVSYSAGDTERNFTLGQSQYNYDFMLRKEDTDLNGLPALSTPDAAEELQATLQHVVLTYSATTGRQIYVNGRLIAINDETLAPLTSWDDSFALLLGTEASNNNQWQGNIRLLAIYNRSLTQTQINQNFNVGVGEKFFLLFSVSELVALANTYILFEVSQYDNYSYLFSEPSIVNLDNQPFAQAVALKSMRIGINGKDATAGQAFAHLNVILDPTQDISSPLLLSPLGTIIALEQGAENDEFFLSFEQIGEHQDVRIPATFSQPEEIAASTDTARIGLRNFAEIHATMSELTGINQQSDKVFTTYERVKQQLPTLSSIDTFISAQQMGITQLAIAYCDLAIDNDNIRNSWFSAVNFDLTPAQAFDETGRANLLTPLLDQLLPLTVTTQPDKTLVFAELDNLITKLSSCDGDCTAGRSRTIAKSVCTAVLASAAILVQ